MPRGGKRKGAGRPKGTGKFGEPTKAVRLPVSKIDLIMQFIERNADMYSLYASDEPIDPKNAEQCDLSGELIDNPATTFGVRVSDDSMKGAGILAGDLLIVDRSHEPKSGDVVVIKLNDKLLVRRLVIKTKKLELKAENPKFKAIQVVDTDDFEIWGVAKNTIHPL